jgi:HEAT repeat protein
MDRLRAALKVRPGEGRMVALQIGLTFCVSAGGSLGGNGVDALFVKRFGVQYLPYLYMALGLVALVTLLGTAGLLSRVSRERLYTGLPLALALALIGERAIVGLELNWFYPVMWLGMNVMGALQGLFTWGLAGMVTDTRQAKRLFPLFGAGNILGAVVGGFLTAPLAGLLRAENLLLAWAAALALAFVLGRALIGGAPGISRARPSTSQRRRASRRRQAGPLDQIRQGFQYVRRSRLMIWISVSSVLLAVLLYSLALPFAKAAAAQYPDVDALAGFLGAFQGLTTGVSLLVSLFVANRLFARVGVTAARMGLPIIYLIGFGALALHGAFPVIAAFRFFEQAWMQGISSAAYQATFNVIPPQRREQVRAFISAGPDQVGATLAGVILAIGGQVLQPQHLFGIGLVSAALATFILWRQKRAYGDALLDALRAGQPHVFLSEEEPFGGFRRDASAVAAVVAGASHGDPAIRRVSVEILGNLPVPEATQALVDAARDPDAAVRAASLRALARAGAASALLEVAARLDDAEPEVRAQAVEALRRLAGYPRGLAAHVRRMLSDADPHVRASAAVALLRAGDDEEARGALAAMATAADAPARAVALKALGECGDADSLALAATGLSDPLPAVRRAAAAALLPAAGLQAQPSGMIERLARALGDDDAAVREAAAQTIGRMGAPALQRVVAALSDPALQSGALLALEYLPSRPAAPAIRDFASERASQALRTFDLARSIRPDGDDRLRLLIDSLHDAARRDALSALRAVGLLGDRDSMAAAIENLKSRDPNQRANALETLESAGDAHVVRPLLRVWEPIEPGAPPPDAWLSRLMQSPDAWLRACAALVARGADEPGLRSALAQLARNDPDAVVRETAQKTLSKGDDVMDTLPTLSLMERILFLRRAPLFADLAPADLKQVAAIAGELYFADGDTIVAQGETGDEMYIIVAGEVRVMAAQPGAAEIEVARRTAGEVVGEMAIISREPRAASLVAAGDVRVLCIDQKRFEGMLRERPETSLAVMRVLIARLKESEARALGMR